MDLGRFDHHPDPAVDYCVEVDALEGMAYDVGVGLASREEFEARIFRASMFRPMIDANALDARRALLALEDKMAVSYRPSGQDRKR